MRPRLKSARKLRGSEFLEVLLSFVIFSSLVLFVLRLSAIQMNVHQTLEEKDLGTGITDILKNKYLELSSGDKKYFLKSESLEGAGTEKLLTDEKFGSKRVAVFGSYVSPLINRYRIEIKEEATPIVGDTEKDSRRSKVFYYSLLKNPASSPASL